MSDAVKPAHTNIDPVPPEIRKAFVTDDEVLQFMVAENYGWTRDIYLDARQTLEMPEELTPQEAAVVDTIEDFDDRRCVYESILDGCVEMAHEICAVTGWADLPPEVSKRMDWIWELARRGCRIPNGMA